MSIKGRSAASRAFIVRAFMTTFMGLTITVASALGCSTASNDTVSAVYKTAFVKATAGPRNPGGKPLSTASAGAWSGGLKLADYQCDVCINGVDNCGQPCGGSTPDATKCGDPGACPCSSGQSTLIGYCGSRAPDAVCTYCPPLTTLDDPCGTLCKLDENARKPPDVVEVCGGNYPVTCSGSCCPSSHSACCRNNAYCGASSDDCKAVDGDAPSGGSSGGTSSSGSSGKSCGVPAGGCASNLTLGKLKAGCCAVSGCLGSCSDGCQSWYEARGSLFGPCAVSDQACIRTAATGAVNACQ